jgi:uncharacterized membrane protein YeaQ/YmgE (transglycosylase-associated protein family)
MLSMIGHMIFGLIVGFVARWIFPGWTPHGLILTMLLGLAGAWVGGILGRMLGLYNEGHPAGFFMAVVGALVLLFAYHLVAGGARRASVAPMTVPQIHTDSVRRV